MFIIIILHFYHSIIAMSSCLKPTVNLYAYQSSGIEWMKEREQAGFILADQMGLGKTIQSLALIDPSEPHPTLAIVPLSVLKQWKTEAEKFTTLRCQLYNSSNRSIQKGINLIITTYNIAAEDERLHQMQFYRIIADEAHQLKNPLTKRFKGINELISLRKVALTGTPVTNKVDDLFSICCFLGMYNYRLKSSSYEKTKQRGLFNRDIRRPGFLENLILRRTIADQPSLTLPNKNEKTVSVILTDEEKARYFELYNSSKKQLVDWLSVGQFTEVLTLLLRLRQAACDLRLVGGLPDNLKNGSKVLNAIHEIREVRRKGEKAILFCNFKDIIHILHRELAAVGIKSRIFVGDMNAIEREKALESFKSETDGVTVLLMSTGAGSVGLNLTEANNIILFDFHWSVTVDLQAIGRVHRIGQKKTVNVIRIVAKDTIDEKILKLQAKKLATIQNVLGKDQEFDSLTSTNITKSDIQEIFD